MRPESKKLREYIKTLEDAGLLVKAAFGEAGAGLADSGVNYFSYDSRDVEPGTLFLCKGAGFREEYLKAAAEAGASVCVAEKDFSGVLPCLVVSDVRKAMALLARDYYGEPQKAFTLVGLTGTKGKSTSLYYLKAIAEAYAAETGKGPFTYLSTIDTYDGVEFFESHLTTPEAPELQKRFFNAASAGSFAMGMEVSSQALKYDRVLGVSFDIASFSNFSPDHIGSTEHPDADDYFNSKIKIFDQSRTAVIDLDTDRCSAVIAAAESSKTLKKIVYVASSPEERCGRKPSMYTGNVRKEGGLIHFDLIKDGERFADISLSMPGLFNVENALIACAIADAMGIPARFMESALPSAKAAGRMEVFENRERGLTVIADYAHNYLSFEKLLKSLREEYPGQRIEILFGCPGGKGYQRRVDLPKAAAEFADFAWITEEDPAFDDVSEICDQVLENLESFGGSGRVIEDRALAIETAIREAVPGTVLVLAAKGREKYMHRGNDYVPIESDAELAERLV